MKAEIKQKWIEALRGGEYKQVVGQLYDAVNDSYCCLGVLAHVCGVSKDTLNSVLSTGFLVDDHGFDHGLGNAHEDGVEFYHAAKLHTLTTTQRQLAALNDNGKNFVEIADWIDANVLAAT